MEKLTLEQLCRGFKESYPAAITDIMDTDFGLHNQWLGPEIRSLTPEMKVAGPAYTIRFITDPISLEDSQYEDISTQIVEGLKPLMVPVIDTGKCKNAGFWGELMCTICSEHGIDGAVVDGGVRDPYYIYKTGFNIFAAFACPHEANYNRSRLDSLQKPIFINDVVIRPGDFIMGDFGGVVVIPLDIVDELYLKVLKLVQQESETRRLIRSGASVKEMLAAGGRL